MKNLLYYQVPISVFCGQTMEQISYYQLEGKILYRESDIQKMLDGNYRKSFL